MFELGHIPSHKDKICTEQPIVELSDIERIKSNLSDKPRDYALFTVGINTAFRCGDLLKLKVGHVRHACAGDEVVLRETKTGKQRRVTLNGNAVSAIHRLLKGRKSADEDLLFVGQRGPLTVSYVNRLVKSWCADIGLNGQYGSHTLRKTWGYQQRIIFKTPIEHLMLAYNHSSPAQTLTYICIQPHEMKAVYSNCL